MAKRKPKLTSANLSLPAIDYKGKDAIAIALRAARLCLLPDKTTVGQFQKAVFPTKRKTALRGSLIIDKSNKEIGMWDDNTTPRWALRWSHGIPGGDKSLNGWRVAHVWNDCNKLDCYTRLENLLLVPAAYAGLTDDDGPLAPYLRYHAFAAYEEWHPECKQRPEKPYDYDSFSNAWQYLDAEDGNACERVLIQLRESQSERAEVLRKFIDSVYYWPQPRGKT